MNTLIIVDVQNDFLPGGSLSVTKGQEVIPIINSIISKYDVVIATQDFHPCDHKSFASQHKNRKPGDYITLHGQKQILWPDHCVQHSFGSKISEDIELNLIDHIVYKGTNKEADSYSAFFDSNGVATNLHQYLQIKQIHTLDIVGLATDYCVKYTVLDALRLKYKVRVLTSACRGINLNPDDIKNALQEMQNKGAIVI
jgi:nicotinamidase/pyrazinamidase